MFRAISLCVLVVACAGCRVSAPMHVWQPPRLASTVGKQVVVSAVVGPDEVSQPLRKQLLATAPQDAGRVTSLIDADALPDLGEVQLVSANDSEPNDVALASVSRRAGADFVLSGQVLQNATSQPSADAPSPLRISWRLLSLNDGGAVAGMPVVVDRETALDRYPDLALVGDPKQRLVSAAVRDTYRLMTPWVDRRKIQLSQPYGLPGSREVRRGIVAARNGRWGEAEAIWESVWNRHPTQIAALHNLALAAAAGQDFSRAKQLARRAVRLSPIPLHKKSLVWIELMQRDYHRAFGLPDPPEGWFVSRPSGG